MQRLWANFWRIWDSIGHWLLSPRGSRLAVITLLGTQAGLLAYSATRHSPTHLEPAFLAAGISHWQFGRFELYRVNPPLVRMVAALPVLAVGCETDWSRFYDGPGSRAEFPVGEDFIKANGPRSIELFFYARWACIPFALIGGYFAYRWAKELYGGGAGLFTLLLWTFEPNLLAHAELITPDSACTSFGIAAGYWFWKWLKTPTWTHVGLAGFFLGLAELSKMSWLILFGLWPTLWLMWRWNSRYAGAATDTAIHPVSRDQSPHASPQNTMPTASQLGAIILIAIYTLNIGYSFDSAFLKLRDFTFISTFFTGAGEPGCHGNRFRDSLLGEVPMPVPKQFLLGLDTQKKDFEKYEHPSYLRGEWKGSGWWYYYIYGLLVKVPCGLWAIFLLVLTRRSLRRPACILSPRVFLGEAQIWITALCLLLLVSSQDEFSQHLRYAFPCLGLGLIFIGQAVAPLDVKSPCGVPAVNKPVTHATLHLMRWVVWSPMTVTILTTYSLTSAMLVFPHHLAYFNEMAGGAQYGWKHMLGSSFDWGQNWLIAKEWIQANNLATINIEIPESFPIDKKSYFDMIGIRVCDSTGGPRKIAILVDANRWCQEPAGRVTRFNCDDQCASGDSIAFTIRVFMPPSKGRKAPGPRGSSGVD